MLRFAPCRTPRVGFAFGIAPLFALLTACGGADHARRVQPELDAGADGASGAPGAGGNPGKGGASPGTGGASPGTGGASPGAGGVRSVDAGTGGITGAGGVGGAAGDSGATRDASVVGSRTDASSTDASASIDASLVGADGAPPDAGCVPSTAAPTLVSRWAAEGDFTDAVGAHSGNDMGTGVTFVTGRVGQAFHFAAASGQYVRVPYDASLDLKTFTISAWIAVPASNVDWGTVLTKQNPTLAQPWLDRNYALFVNRGDVCAKGLVMVSFTGAPTGCSITTVDDGAFHHVAGTFDGCVARVYVDGVLENSVTASPPALGPSQELWLGKWAGSGGDESLDEVRLYSGALDAAAIATLAAAP